MPSSDRQPPARTPEEQAILRRLGDNLRDKRVKLPAPEGRRSADHLSQEQFALDIDVHRTVVSQIERGLVNVSILTAARIAKGLGITISELVDGIDE